MLRNVLKGIFIFGPWWCFAGAKEKHPPIVVVFVGCAFVGSINKASSTIMPNTIVVHFQLPH
jgi:hypothetical protein